MPFGNYKDFADCVNDQTNNKNKDKITAQKICAVLEKKLSGSQKTFSDSQLLNIVTKELDRQELIKKAQKYGMSAQKALEAFPQEDFALEVEDEGVQDTLDSEDNPDNATEGPEFDSLGADQSDVNDNPGAYNIDTPDLESNDHAKKYLQSASEIDEIIQRLQKMKEAAVHPNMLKNCMKMKMKNDDSLSEDDAKSECMDALDNKNASVILDTILSADTSEDHLVELDASLMSAASKCTEGKYKGELCLIPPDGWPVTDGGKLSAKRVRAALTYGSQYGKLAQLKKNGLCTYAKKVGVDSTYCGGGTQESSLDKKKDPEPVVKSASTHLYDINKIDARIKSAMSWDECISQAQSKGVDDPEKMCGWLKNNGPNASLIEASLNAKQVHAFEQNNKLFIKAFLLDSSVNLNNWGVSPHTLDANINSYIGKPICLQDNFDHPDTNDNNLQHQLAYQDSFRIGTIVDIVKSGSVYSAIAEITDPGARDAFKQGQLPLYVSPQLFMLDATEPQNNITSWTGTHLAVVRRPAYTIQKANVTNQCNGDKATCLTQLKKAALMEKSGYGCGFCTYKLLNSLRS